MDIVREYNDGLVLYINSFVNNITVADELAEDTFVKLGMKKPRYAGRSSFKTWLYAIGRNVALDHMRRQSRAKTVPLDDCAGQADEELLETRYLRQEQKILLHRAMGRLRPEYRQVLCLHMRDGTAVELRLIEGGYVDCPGLGWGVCVKMPGEAFNAVLEACLRP